MLDDYGQGWIINKLDEGGKWNSLMNKFSQQTARKRIDQGLNVVSYTRQDDDNHWEISSPIQPEKQRVEMMLMSW